MKKNLRINLTALATILGLIGCLLTLRQAHAQIDSFTFFVPFFADDIDAQFAEGRADAADYLDAGIEMTVSIAVLGDNTLIYYDQWEDLLEPDLTSPTQASTQVWGDGNPANGIPPNFGTDTLVAGSVITLNNDVDLPRDSAQLRFDGGDKFSAIGGIVSVSVAVWPIRTPPQPPAGEIRVLYADSWELYPTSRWGTLYIMPIGQNITRNLFTTPPSASPNGSFQVVGLNVQATQDGTSIELDPQGDGSFETPVTRNQGEQLLRVSGINAGARVRASAPVQVHLIATDPDRAWEMRGFTMLPESQWTNDYVAPRSSDGDFWLYNPTNGDLVVSAETISGTTAITIPALGTGRYPPPGDPLLGATGVHFTANADFYGVAALDAASAQDWGYALLPNANLTTQVLVAWGIGNYPPPPNGNESQLYVTALNSTTIQVDYDNNGSTDNTVNVGILEEVPISDPDNDMTGAFLSTTDGTSFVVAWGQDQSANNALPSIDAGDNVTPLVGLSIKQVLGPLLIDGDCTGAISPGDIVRVSLQYFNNTVLGTPNNVIITDNLPAELSYIPNSTAVDGAPVPDATSGTPFLLDDSGFNVGTLAPRATGLVTFDTLVTGAPPTITNRADIGLQNLSLAFDAATVNVPVGAQTPILAFNKTLLDPAGGSVTAGQVITFGLTITNTSNSTVTTLPVQDTFASAYLTFLNAAPPPDVTATDVVTWNNLLSSLGLTDLQPGATASTAVSFVVNQLPPDLTTISNAGAVVGAQRSDSVRPLNCSANISLAVAGPPTPTPTPPPPDPTSSPGGGGNTTPRPPTLTPAPVAAIVPAPPTPVIPVAFLPETGIREFGWGDLAITAGFLLLILGGISAARRFSNKD